MDVSILPLQKIFALDVQFRVPLYQRPYVWERDRQWEPLWDDVASLAERYLSAETQSAHHFLGAVVVRQQPSPVGTLEIRDVIDGQQRLTTLQLLGDAVEEVIREDAGPAIESKKLRKLVLNDPDLFLEDDRFKVWPTNEDQPVFRFAMTDQDRVPAELVDKPIARAHAYFKSAARAWAQDTDTPNSTAERYAALVKAVSYGLHLVVIDLSESDNAQAIFETLNARGTPLLASDLVKNHILNEAQTHGLDVHALHAAHWQPFEEEWWRDEITLGRLSWPRVDAFLFYWLGMSLTREVNTQRLFDEYRDLLRSRELTVEQVAADLSSYARVFRSLEEEDSEDAALTQFFYRWKTTQLRVMTPLLLWLFSDTAELDDASRVEALELLESWFMRRMICGWRTHGYQNFLHPLLREVKNHRGDAVVDAIRDILSDATAINTAWPRDDAVRDAVLQRPIYQYISRARLRLVLEAVEDRLCTLASKSESLCPKNLTIEHLLPVSWSDDDWPYTGSIQSREERRALLHTLGNLTLVNEKLNPSLSNSPWIEKRTGLAEHSTLHLNKVLANPAIVSYSQSWYEEWNEDSIQERGEWLADHLCKIWPRAE